MKRQSALIHIDDYIPIVGLDRIELIKAKARKLNGSKVVNVNSTMYGGGVAELLTSSTLLINSLGIKTGWRVIQGSPDFFSITKKMHNALQGGEINLSELKMMIYEEVLLQNAIRMDLDHDFVVIHDPQPLALIERFKKKGPWIWRCHIDLSNPNDVLWDYMKPQVEKYDAAIVSIPEYRQEVSIPQLFFMPAIDPFSIKNMALSENEIDERLNHYDIPTDLPLIVQISRFDRFKDPEGVIEAYKLASEEVEGTLVLLGNVATDDPEGEEVYQSILKHRSDRIIIISRDDTALVNALQSRAVVVLQKSKKEGFGLTVTEAMWKGTPVIGGKVGGIKYQINHGKNGYLVSSVEEAAQYIVELIKHPEIRIGMGSLARESVKEKFLMTRLVENYIDLFNSFEANYTIPGSSDILKQGYASNA